MKEKWQKILNIGTAVLLVVCIVKINNLQNDITNLKNIVQNNQSMLQSSIANISYNVGYEMEQANNLLSDSSWNTGGLDMDNKTATLYCYVVPKEYNPEKTVANIVCNQTSYPMALENGRYTAQITLPLFEESVIDNVQFTDDGTICTQQLDWHINPRYDMVPTAYINYSGSSKQDYSGKDITRTYSGYLEIDFEHKGLVKDVKNAEIVILVNDSEVWKHNAVLEELYGDEYISHYRAEIEHSFDIKRGDTIKMYAEITDENGWTYHSVLEDATIGEKGNPIPNREYYHAEADIYDADGNKVFDGLKF